MQAIEFHAFVKDGAIVIPQEHLPQLQGGVTVTIVPDSRQANSPNLVEQLLAHPLRMEGFEPLSREESHER